MPLLDSATLEISIYLTQVLRGNTVTLKLWWETWSLKLVDLLDLAYQEIVFDDNRQKNQCLRFIYIFVKVMSSFIGQYCTPYVKYIDAQYFSNILV